MRTRHRCPKCNHGEVLYVPEPRELAIGPVTWTRTIGALESYTCMACGYTELYVRDLQALDVSKIRDARVLTAEPPDAPHR